MKGNIPVIILALLDRYVVPKRRYGIILRFGKSQKSADLVYIAVEA
jgi:hypothetical protein